MFDADRPIVKSDQDKLNRSSFAKYLARSILNHTDPDSLVIGLYGRGGSGKTSLINLILEEITFASNHARDEEKPIVLNFSPWSYSGQHQLIYSFFRRLSSSLRQASYLKQSDRIIYLLELYVSFFTRQGVPYKLRLKKNWWQRLFNRRKFDNYAWESGRDLTLIKSELNHLLRGQQHKIIIIIDNISRLYPEEIKEIFQIVKSIGDYANTAYLLAFDKKQVTDALSKLEGIYAEFLVDKVVQLAFDVPPILSQDIENIFADRLKNILSSLPDDSWNKEYWADIYYASLRYFFNNCRDITRYINILQFSYQRLKEVVNPVDFFALTALQVFLPSVYEGVRDNKDLFTDLIDNVYPNTNITEDKERCEEIINRAQHFPKKALEHLLIALFPRLRHIYLPNNPYYHSELVARKLKRISSPDLFDVYFSFSLQTSFISQSEFKTILALSNDILAFDQALARLNKDDKILKFLDLLDNYLLEKISREESRAIIIGLFNNGDLFPRGNNRLLSLDTETHIHRIIHQILEKIDNQDERYQILEEAISHATKSIYTMIYELIQQGHEHEENSIDYLPMTYRLLSQSQLKNLQNIALKQIKAWAYAGRLFEHPQLLFLLNAWRLWDDEKSYRTFIREVTKTDRGLLQFLTAFLAVPIREAMTKYEKKSSWGKYLELIENFIEIKTLGTHAKVLFEDNYFEKLRENEQLAIMILLDLTKIETEKIIPKTII